MSTRGCWLHGVYFINKLKDWISQTVMYSFNESTKEGVKLQSHSSAPVTANGLAPLADVVNKGYEGKADSDLRECLIE